MPLSPSPSSEGGERKCGVCGDQSVSSSWALSRCKDHADLGRFPRYGAERRAEMAESALSHERKLREEAERERDENEAVFKVWRRRSEQAEALLREGVALLTNPVVTEGQGPAWVGRVRAFLGVEKRAG